MSKHILDPLDPLPLTEKEKWAMECIGKAFEAIKQMDDYSALTYNVEELVASVHVMQSFVKQHVLNRVDPSYWNNWWGDDIV